MGVDWCPYTIIWTIWKERYDRIFREVVASFQEGLNLVKVRIGKWVMLKKACQNNNLVAFFTTGRHVWLLVLSK